MCKISRLLASVLLIIIGTQLQAQFRNTYGHGFSEDHISLIKKHDGYGYVQASTAIQGDHDVHLMKFDAAGNVLLDKIFYNNGVDEYALDVCLGNGNTFLVCGYENIGGLDIGFVLQVDSSFNVVNKTNIQVPANNRHTPALKIINSAYYEQNVPGNYWPGDPSQGYLVVGFEADGYNSTQAKSSYAIKMTNALSIQWARKFDSPTVGGDDWDMCSNANWMWIGSFGYLVGGSGTSPAGAQCAMAACLDLNGNVQWSQLYSDNNGASSFCVSADGAYDDAEFEFYHLVNFSQTRSGGIIAFNQYTGAINMARSRYLDTPYNDYYCYEFGSSCASQDIYISGYGLNQVQGNYQGIFPFVIRYDKNTPAMYPWVPRFSYPTQSVTYNPSSGIFSTFSTTAQPRIYYPKHFASRVLNIWSVAGFEDLGTEHEMHLIHPQFDGTDSCGYMDPQIQPVPLNIFTFPLNNAAASYTTPSVTSSQTNLTYMVYSCCPADANFTITNNGGCNYTFQASGISTPCSSFMIMDNSNNVIGGGAGTTLNHTFTQNGTYIVCYSACAMGNAGIPCRKETCQTVVVTCATPCGTMDADFSFTVNGCTVNVSDLTPDGNIYGCEKWTFGNTTVFAGDVTSFTFPGSGTYTICHTDCCLNSADGNYYYHTVCKQVTVNCTPPCCLPTNWVKSINNCCVQFTPVWGNGTCAFTNFYWNFGDGNVSNLPNPLHCYNGSGIYTVTMTAWCSKFQKITITKTIKVKCALPPPPPCCTGTARIAYSNNGLLLTASDASIYTSDVTPNTFEWNWGDGTTSSGMEASHYYASPGSYQVTLTVGYSSSTGTSFQDDVTEQINVNLTPVCTCSPQNILFFASSPVICSTTGHSTSLRVVDFESEAGIVYQWMYSSSPGGPYEDVEGLQGTQVWVDQILAPAYYRCRATCQTTGATSFSQEVALTDAHIEASAVISPPNICLGGQANITITSPLADAFEWEPNVSSNGLALVSPAQTTLYSVLATNEEGCGALAESTLTVDNCVVPGNDSPSTAIAVAYSSNMVFPNCYPISGDNSFAADSPESSEGAGPDTWFRFVAQSTAVSITLTSATADDMILLYQKVGSNYILMAGGMENSSSGAGDFERLNYQGLTPGTTYYVCATAADATGGTYTLCIQHLMPSGCAYSVPAAGFNLCNAYKAVYRGAPSGGVTYAFNFTGVGGGAPAQTTTVSGTNGFVALSHPSLALQYGGVYNVRVDVSYALLAGNGSTEVIVVNGATSSPNCSNVTIAAQPLIEVRSNQRCNATLFRSSFLIGSPVPGSVSACGAINYTYEFMPVVSCLDASPTALQPVEYTTPGSAPFLQLGVLPSLSSVGAWRVRIRPNFSYGSGIYGPPQFIQVNGTAASAMLPEEEYQDYKLVYESDEMELFPNPNNGERWNVKLNNVETETLEVILYDHLGRLIFENSYYQLSQNILEITPQVQLVNGIYYLEMRADGLQKRFKMVVAQ